MTKYDGKLLSRAVAAGAALFCTHMAFAAGPAMPQEQQLAPLGAQIAPTLMPAVLSSGPTIQPLPAAPAAIPVDTPDAAIDPRQIECIAKVIRHEAANQPVDGQVAVAQVIVTRMQDGRFPTTPCGVARQRGQFFDIDAYDPPRNDARWQLAVRIATDTLEGDSDNPAGGALFFHSGGVGMPGRTRVTQIADHTFYR